VVRAGGPLIHVGTRCGSIDEFVERFAPFATETSLVMPAMTDAKVGTEGRFVIRLKDKSAVMSGRCRVEEVRPVASAAGTGPRVPHLVMRVRLLQMDEASRNLHRQLLACKRPAPQPVAAPKPPLRIVRAPTLIGTPAPPVPAVAPRPFVQDAVEATVRESLRAPETRAPAASFTLPANPLSDMEADDLASFIECTLFEADGETAVTPAHAASDDAKTPLAIAVGPGQAPPRLALSDSKPGLEAAVDPASARLRRNLVRAAPYVVCTLLGVLVGSALRGSSSKTPPSHLTRDTQLPVAAPSATAAPSAIPAPSANPAPPATEAPPSTTSRPATAAPPATAAARAKPAARAGTCSASVTTEHADATVVWGTRPLGKSPLQDVPVPCGDATVTLRHERYQDVKRALTAEPGRAAIMSERLRRPPGTLALSSSPPGARFMVNGQALGAGPRKVSIWRFEHVHVEASLPGYQSWSKTVYVKEPTMKLNAQLARR
jgi:hypothetical protein